MTQEKKKMAALPLLALASRSQLAVPILFQAHNRIIYTTGRGFNSDVSPSAFFFASTILPELAVIVELDTSVAYPASDQ